MVGLNWTTELGNFMVTNVDYGVELARIASQLSHLLWLWDLWANCLISLSLCFLTDKSGNDNT